ncbi:MAG: laccase domain-containing protein, partial [Rhodothermales bacterium]
MNNQSDYALLPEVFQDLPGIVAGFTTRHGGVSSEPFRSLNLGLSTGDDSALVTENRRRMLVGFGLDPSRMAIAGQVHGDRVKVVLEPGLYPGYDAIVTREPSIVLCITAADCAVILLADAEA